MEGHRVEDRAQLDPAWSTWSRGKCKERYGTVVANVSTVVLGHGTTGVKNDGGSLSF